MITIRTHLKKLSEAWNVLDKYIQKETVFCWAKYWDGLNEIECWIPPEDQRIAQTESPLEFIKKLYFIKRKLNLPEKHSISSCKQVMKWDQNSGDPPEIEKEANPPRIQRDTSSCEMDQKIMVRGS